MVAAFTRAGTQEEEQGWWESDDYCLGMPSFRYFWVIQVENTELNYSRKYRKPNDYLSFVVSYSINHNILIALKSDYFSYLCSEREANATMIRS